MINFNPMHYLRHAWDATNSTWGKTCIVLFYTFLWLQILGCVISLFDSKSGWDCLYGNLSSQDEIDFVAGTMKVSNLWILGFFLFADRSGIKVWNVLMVWFFYLVQWMLYKPVMTNFMEGSCPTELQAFNVSMIVTAIWISLALVSSFMEKRATPTGPESAPLVT
mmetsp:Transcript_10460/g.25273  ORF Transcript_10460/g.25273 Transcript_10460/m.25273 type:complete len:165 (-) Transcript_10460:1958-2452(-)|eukprot:CAMPEP_0113648946 /NCGR_PEP_ID=MMETSP0017_2-20120614/25991_1 /TAXON_ID=2856 /ORGANISM="Cylindrotheca closterium" /LENGTH=164 /DNA_ID=CAMNT_0000561255 /DNA_START=126 /DNA_END=620 /DNA_ORIENTATION=- /assembly_acc=CAM_ASM_000147